MLVLLSGSRLEARARTHHRAARAAGFQRHNDHFAGGGTGGDSPKPDAGGPELLFTFDDGPVPANTTKVLDLLDQHGYKAVFFVCGVHFQGKSPAADKGRAMLREIVRRGHLVGNHTIHHLFLCNPANATRVVEEVEGNGKLIAESLGEPPYLFRTPYGAHCPVLNQTLKNIGVRPIGWDIDPQDWRLRNPAKIETAVKASLRNLTGRAILLLHDVQPATVLALPKILAFLDQENERRTKIGQAPIKVINPDYLLETKTPKSPVADALAETVIDLAAPLARMLGLTN
jgi:peptidoglycan/xylan/chitin deacetylase (PgdA/CDA1 family)